jgi:hypothetical protein
VGEGDQGCSDPATMSGGYIRAVEVFRALSPTSVRRLLLARAPEALPDWAAE